jgi:hypothetical protein
MGTSGDKHAITLLIALSWAHTLLRFTLCHPLAATASAVIMALPYLLLRLVAGSTAAPARVRRLGVGGLLAAAVSLYALAPDARPRWLTLLYVLYFMAVTLYGADAVERARRHATGLTRRRLQAVAAGALRRVR